ncbi:MAG: 23S rRNA pseudouridine(1911/1915/1917) synthase RluD [Betaproteobacteria bacterium]|nr:23S rRNA pseudouridine(1911/1915/1917) synthase RluD [Betaproteobacteria bacterium]
MLGSLEGKAIFGDGRNDNKSAAIPDTPPTTALHALIPASYAGLRLDQALARLFPDYSRSLLQSWVKEGLVQVNGLTLEAKNKIWGGEKVVLHAVARPGLEAQPQDIALDIVHEDDSLIVIDKPPGLVVHPGNGNVNGTLMNALLFHAPALANLPRAGIVHRLDKDTSGLMAIAKTEQCHAHLVSQLQARSVTRIYHAIAVGQTPPIGKVSAAIGRHPTQRTKMAAIEQGRAATTHFRTLKQTPLWSLLECKLETGRTHQIRVHMAHLGFPLIGDRTYGSRSREGKLPLVARQFARQALHAAQLALVHPAMGQEMRWQRPAPEDFQQLLAALERAASAPA